MCHLKLLHNVVARQPVLVEPRKGSVHGTEPPSFATAIGADRAIHTPTAPRARRGDDGALHLPARGGCAIVAAIRAKGKIALALSIGRTAYDIPS